MKIVGSSTFVTIPNMNILMCGGVKKLNLRVHFKTTFLYYESKYFG